MLRGEAHDPHKYTPYLPAGRAKKKTPHWAKIGALVNGMVPGGLLRRSPEQHTSTPCDMETHATRGRTTEQVNPPYALPASR